MDDDGYSWALVTFLVLLFFTFFANLNANDRMNTCRQQTIELIKINKATMQDLNSCS